MLKTKIFFILLTAYISISEATAEKTLQLSLGEWPPYMTRDLKHNGPIAHLIKDIFKDEGYNVQFNFYPWARAYKLASVGSQDLTAVWLDTPERRKEFYYSDVVLDETFVYFHLKSFNFNWQKIEDLKDIKIGAMRSSSHGKEFNDALDSGLIKLNTIVSTNIQNFKLLLSKRNQVFPQELNVGYYMLEKKLHIDDRNLITHHSKPLFINHSYLLFPKNLSNSLKLLSIFNKRLKKYKMTGKYNLYIQALRKGDYLDNSTANLKFP